MSVLAIPYFGRLKEVITYDYLSLSAHAAHKLHLEYGFTDGATPALYGSRYVNADIPEVTAQGLLTGTRTFLPDTGQSLLSSYYYDLDGRVVQRRSQNHLSGYEKDFFAYTFSGKVLRHLHVHSSSGRSPLSESYTYVYDGRANDNPERLQKVIYQLDGTSPVTMFENVYDELGRVVRRKLHDSSNTIDYRYNIRNWLSSIENPHFTQRLYYHGGTGTQRCYNGNISSLTWKSGDESLRGYVFTYDALNRLQHAVYGEGEGITPASVRNFSEKVTGYDSNGNILGLERYGSIWQG